MTFLRGSFICVVFVLLTLLAGACGSDGVVSDSADDAVAAVDEAMAGDPDADADADADASDGEIVADADASDDGDVEADADAADGSTEEPAAAEDTSDVDEGPDEAAAEVDITVPEFDDRVKPEVDFSGEKLAELSTTDIIEGDGPEAVDGSIVDVHYVGVLNSDGTEFDASWNRGQPFQFVIGAGNVIQGWDQGVAGMRAGGRRLISIPSDLAYGSQARGEIIVADSDLVFVVDLHCVTTAGDPDAEPTLSVPDPLPTELVIDDLVEGTGDASVEGDVVQIEFTSLFGSNGEKFASTWDQGALPASFQAGGDSGIAGLDEGLVGVKVGGTRLLTVPPDLAFGAEGLPGQTVTAPQVAPNETILIQFNVVAINPCQ